MNIISRISYRTKLISFSELRNKMIFFFTISKYKPFYTLCNFLKITQIKNIKMQTSFEINSISKFHTLKLLTFSLKKIYVINLDKRKKKEFARETSLF